MSNEILSVLEYMEKEKGIARVDMITAISSAIKNAAQRGINAGQELKIDIDPKNGALKAWKVLEVVDSVSEPMREIHIEKARQEQPEIQLGDFMEREIDPSHLGRIAAQTARQAIMQQVRQFEKERIYDDYKDVVGDIMTGTVRRRERGDLIVDLGKAEALLPARERIPGEDYAPGERIRCLLKEIDNTPRGPELILSRASLTFIRRLFELEVTEIADGTVTIEGMAREPGYRTKVCVSSKDPKVDPVGACVGARGARVKSIVRELGGEKIDIIKFFADPEQMLHEAVSPAVPRNTVVDEAARRIYFEVAEDQLSIAIGRRGQNAKLTSKLLGWRLDIAKEKPQETGFEQKIARATEGMGAVSGLTDEEAQRLVTMGITSPEAFESAETEDLIEGGFSEEEAQALVEKFSQYRKTLEG